MKKLYEKNQLTFALLWIVVYCVLQSLANPLNKRIGIEYSASAAFCILQAVILFAFIRKNHLQKRYGLCRSSVSASRFLYYVPLFILASGNLWNGIALNYSLPETVCRIVCICNELFTWADVYGTANHDERRAILQQFIKEIRVRKDYEISITLNASFNQVEQLKAVSTYDGAEIFEEISEKGA